MNAFCYMVLGRMIHFYVPDHRILKLKAGTFAGCFVILDIVCFVVQLIGGGMAGVGAPPEQMKKGLEIYKAGIALQEIFVILIIGLAVKFQLKMRMLERSAPVVLLEKKTWPRLLYAIYTALICISTRIVFRLVEFSNGTTSSNKILNVEWYQYVFDSVPMFFAGLVLAVCHPGMVLQGKDSEMPVSAWRKRWALRRSNRKKRLDDQYEAMLLDRIDRQEGTLT